MDHYDLDYQSAKAFREAAITKIYLRIRKEEELKRKRERLRGNTDR